MRRGRPSIEPVKGIGGGFAPNPRLWIVVDCRDRLLR
jgi:hypothetical protein